ncbi:NrsF family protein [Sphingosinithalassobacter portus]|uniref:NrsF family protein n=1 Tax=Stakelama portus TaxID=2676234 RepID=UPI000D6E6D22|nr:DUF1109 domain-containing protein [Sphingosinithalassobacter portus]
MTSTDALIHDLSANLAPVERRKIGREALAVLALGVAELALILMLHGPRDDMGQVILSPFMIWKIGSLALLAAVSCVAAMRSFAPQPSSRRWLLPMLFMGAAVIVSGILVTPAADSARSILARLDPAEGVICTMWIIILALPMVALLGMFMREAAPMRPRQSAIAAGLAASMCGALVFTACCRMNDPLYIMVWYSVGVIAVTAAARWLLPWRFRL